MSRRSTSPRLKKLLKALVLHPSTALRREAGDAGAYPVHSWWWEREATDQLFAEAEACLLETVDADLRDQIFWHRHALFWMLGRFAEAEADLLALNRADSVYRPQIGRPLGFIRKHKRPHEVF